MIEFIKWSNNHIVLFCMLLSCTFFVILHNTKKESYKSLFTGLAYGYYLIGWAFLVFKHILKIDF